MNIHKRQLAGQARGAGGHVMSRSECGCEMRVGVEPASVRRRRRAHVLALVALLLLLMVPGDADALGPNWDAQARPDAQERSVRSRKLDLDGTGGMEVKLTGRSFVWLLLGRGDQPVLLGADVVRGSEA